MQGRRRIGVSSLLLALIFLLLSPITHADDACAASYDWQMAELNEDEMLIVVLRVNNRPMSSSIDLFPFQDTYLVPISNLREYFGLDWMFEIEPLRFYSRYKDNSPLSCEFDFDFQSKAGAPVGYWYSDDFDTYVDVNIIAQLLDGDVSVNFELLQLNFTSSYETLGLDRSDIISTPNFFSKPEDREFPVIPDEYRLFTVPLVNYRANLSYSGEQKKLRYRGNVNAFFDLAYMAADYRFSSSNNQQQQFLRLSKNIVMNEIDTQSVSLQQINDRSLKYELGDISFQGDELVSNAGQGLGLNVFTHSQNQRRNFSEVRIEENVLPGWRAVLFRNGQFIEEQESNDQNQVVFENIPTFYGINTFEIRLYGPEGQEETRQQIVNVGQQMLAKGEFDFRMQAQDARRRLLDGYLGQSSQNKQYSVAGMMGLSSFASGTAEFQRQYSEDGEYSDYASMGLDMTIGGSLVRLKHVHQLGEGNAMFLGINSKINKNISSNLTHVALNRFDSDKYQSEKGLKTESRARLNARFELGKKINTSLTYTDRRFVDNAYRRTISANVSHDFMGSTLSNTLQHDSSDQGNMLSHRMFWSHSVGDWRIRHSLGWQPLEDFALQNYSANIRWPQTLKMFNETRFNYRKENINQYELSHQMNWRTDYFNFQLGGTVNENGEWIFRMGISGDMYFDKNRKRVGFSRPRGNQISEVNAFAFLDYDRNNRFDNDDEVIPEVGFTGKSTWKKLRTNEEGKTQLFTSARYQAIEIDEATLQDPFIAAKQSGYIVATHAGGMNKVAYPLVTVNDIEGIVTGTKNRNSKGLGGLTVTLLELGGGNFYTTRTESDGFYFFTKIPPGKYKLLLNKEIIAGRGFAVPDEPIIIEAPDLGDIVAVDDIALVDTKTHNERLAKKRIEEAKIYSDNYQKVSYMEIASRMRDTVSTLDLLAYKAERVDFSDAFRRRID